MKNESKKIIWYLFSGGLKDKNNIEELRRVFMFNILVFLGGFFIFVLGLLSYFQGSYRVVVADSITLGILLFLFFYHKKTHNYVFCSTFAVALTGVFFAYLSGTGGVGGASHVWIFTYPLISIFLLGNQRGAFFSLVLFSFVGIVFFAGNEIPYLESYDFNIAIRALSAYFLIFLFAAVMEELRDSIQKNLNKSKVEMEKSVTELEKAQAVKENLIHELKELMNEVSTLQGILPMCSCCKKIRNDEGFWDRVENFITDHTEAQFSHGICPDCIKELYSEEDFDDD